MKANVRLIDLRMSDTGINKQLGIEPFKTPAHWKPRVNVGDVVVLNNYGLEQIFERSAGLSYMQTLKMRITYVDSVSCTESTPTFPVEVDNPEINLFLLDDRCFDRVVEVEGSFGF